MKKRGYRGLTDRDQIKPPFKRCKSLSRGFLDLRCQKPRGHVEEEIDIVHQHGIVVWGEAAPRPVSVTLTQDQKPIDISHMVAHVAFGAPQIEEHAQLGRLLHGFDEATEQDSEVMHSMCTESCGPTCNVTATMEQQLTEWWIQQAEDEAARTVPKAVEYSATDLTDIGMDLARTMGREVSDEEAAELGVFFYLRGKVARWVGAVMAGQRVSDDTLFDIGVYVRMAQRIREAGSWPGVENHDGN